MDAFLSVISRHVFVARAVLAIFLACGGLMLPVQSQAASPLVGPKTYYLAMGTSISFGFQPNWDWSHGYTDQWYNGALRSLGVKTYVNYSCPGDNTDTMIHGGCQDAQWQRTPFSGPQLAAGVAFLNGHRGQVSPVTLDMGIVDILHDINSSSCRIPSTVASDLAAIDNNLVNTILPQITGAMKDSNGVMAGDLFVMNYYDPYQNRCANTVPVVQQLNQHLAADVALFPGTRMIDVFTAFGGAPSPNPNICKYTWWCVTNIDAHPTGGQGGEPGNGYGVIANAFQAATYGAPQPPTTGGVSGQVTMQGTSTPIKGATVSVTGSPALTATTDVNGNYTLSGLPAGPQSLTASATGYATSDPQNVTILAGQSLTGINFALQRTFGTVTGTVTDASANPLVGATVSAGGVSTTTIGGGAYTLSNVPTGPQAVTASMSGFASMSQSVTVAVGPAVTVNFELSPQPGTISGQVMVQGTSTPIKGATISVSGIPGLTATTDANGTYTLNSVPVGTRSLSASAPGYATSGPQNVSVTPGATIAGINFGLTPTTGTISGKVTVAGTSTGISGATVNAGGATTQTASDGTYTLTGVTPGTNLTVTASATGYASAQVSNVTVVVGQTTANVNLQLTPTAGTLSGTVRVRGTAYSGATVTLSGSGITRSTTTNRYGQYQITNVPAGTYTVTASAYFGFVRQSQTVTVSGNTTLNFSL